MAALVYDYVSIASHMKGELAPIRRWTKPTVIELKLDDEQVFRFKEEWEKGKNGNLRAINEPYCILNYKRGHGKYSVYGCVNRDCVDSGMCHGCDQLAEGFLTYEEAP